MAKTTLFKLVTVALTIMLISPGQPEIAGDTYQFSYAANSSGLTSPVTQSELNIVVSKSKSALAFLDQLWAEEFRKANRPFAKPGGCR